MQNNNLDLMKLEYWNDMLGADYVFLCELLKYLNGKIKMEVQEIIENYKIRVDEVPELIKTIKRIEDGTEQLISIEDVL